MRAVLFSMLLSTGLAIASSPASAAPISAAPMSGALSEAGQASGQLMLVRNGCGRGRHFSRYRGICVWNGVRSYGRPYGYVAPYRTYRYVAPYYTAPAYDYGYYGPRYFAPPIYGPPLYGTGYYGPGYGYGYYGYRYGYYGYRRW